ncbi:MAG: helix-turn-helix domain-containing protein [Spirochaetales bacterium]
MENNNVGKTIANLRRKNNLTQSQLAEKLFVSDKAISRWESGVGLPEIANLIELSKVFGVSVDYIVNGQGAEMTQPVNSAPVNEIRNYERQYETPKRELDADTVKTMSILSISLSGFGLIMGLIVNPFVGIVLAIIGLILALVYKDQTSLSTVAKILSIVSVAICGIITIYAIISLINNDTMVNNIFDLFKDIMNDFMDFGTSGFGFIKNLF